MKSYNTSVNSFDRMVVPQGRKVPDLAVGDQDAFPRDGNPGHNPPNLPLRGDGAG